MMTFIASVIKLWLTGNYWVDIMDAKPQKWIYCIYGKRTGAILSFQIALAAARAIMAHSAAVI